MVGEVLLLAGSIAVARGEAQGALDEGEAGAGLEAALVLGAEPPQQREPVAVAEARRGAAAQVVRQTPDLE